MLAENKKIVPLSFEKSAIMMNLSLYTRTILLFVILLLPGVRPLKAETVISPVTDSPIGNSITALLQDDDGFIWVGTIAGLTRYDMYTYRRFGECDGLPISRTMIRSLAKDKNGNIWIGTESGALLYNPEREEFRRIGGATLATPIKTITPTSGRGGETMLLTTGEGVAIVDPESLEHRFLPGKQACEYLNNILTTTVDNRGDIWGWSHGRLLRFDFSKDPMAPAIESWPFPYEVRALAVDSLNRLWFNDRRRLMIVPLPAAPEEELSPAEVISSAIDVRAIRIDNSDVIVTSYYDGIHSFRIDAKGRPVENPVLWIDPSSPNEVSNSVLCVIRDRDGNLWFGTVDGIYVGHERPREVFHNLSARNGGKLIHNVVSDVCLDSDGSIWAATSGSLDHIRRTAPGHYTVDHFMPRFIQREQPDIRRLQTLTFDPKGRLWLGTKQTLLFFDPQQQEFFDREEITGFLSRHGAQFSKELLRDRQGNIWMGFIYGGLFVFEASDERCRFVRFAGTDLYDANIQTILDDPDGNIWIGTKTKGLLRFRTEEMTAAGDTLQVNRFDTYFIKDHTLPGFISVNTLHRTENGELYAGTSQGLFRYNRTENDFEECPLNAFDEKVWVLDIQPDAQGQLWISTMQGVYCYTPGAAQSPFYELSDGAFARLDYNLGGCLTEDGTLFLGGINGINYFDPTEVPKPHPDNEVYVSGISILNQPLSPDGIHLEANINHSHHLTLRHNDHQFALDFTTLCFSAKGQPRFFYKIDNLTPDWIPLNGNRLSFSSLAHGDYTLQIKAADSSRMLSDATTDIRITVLPPWWLTWWAYCIYGILILLIGAAILWIIIIRYRAAQQVRMVQYKQQLFINLTHGFKTPLTMMQVPLQLISDGKGGASLDMEERQKLINIISTNVKKLANTIRQLMEFRKIDQNRVSLNLAEMDIAEYVHRICNYFQPLFESKRLHFDYLGPEERILMTFDPEKIELALYNLLQNAYTFTPAGGSIQIRVFRKQQKICISVRDTGIGIRAEHLDKIFLRFWQVHDPDTMPPLGAGIGLAVAKEFIEIHGGHIAVESRYGAGSTFTISLPRNPRFNTDQYYIHRQDQAGEEEIIPAYTKQYAETDVYVEQNPEIDPSKPHTIYIMAGGGDITGLVRMVLPDFNVLHYNNIEEIMKAIREHRPQIILIDIVVYDREEGLEFCRKLKKTEWANDIPIILLTADSSAEDARLFCELGVDSWMEKPFDVELFRARTRQLAERHTDLQKRLKLGQILGKHEEIVVESADEKFMNRVTEIIEQNLSNEEFSLEVFAREMRVSRSVLNMRIQHIVGKSPMELLRNARLQRAAQLLETKAYDIAQVSYMVGFSDPRYFSTCFKKQFGVSPRIYIQNRGNE